jgi:hypothetical protein
MISFHSSERLAGCGCGSCLVVRASVQPARKALTACFSTRAIRLPATTPASSTTRARLCPTRWSGSKGRFKPGNWQQRRWPKWCGNQPASLSSFSVCVITVSSLSWQTARLREREHEQKKRKYTHNPSVFFVRLNIAGKARDDIVTDVFQSDDTLPNEAGKRKKRSFLSVYI